MNPITIVSSRFLSSDELDLRIERKPFSLSQGDFTVTNADGGVIFDIKQNFFSLFGRRVMFDTAGIPVLSFHKKNQLWSFIPGWGCIQGDSKEKLLCAKRSPFFPFITSLNVFLGCNTKENVCDFKVKSGWFDESCTIYAGDDTTTVAKVLSFHNRWVVYRGDSSDSKDIIFSAKRSSLIQFKTSLDVFLGCNEKESVCDYKVKGSWFDRSCTIYAGERTHIVAKMHKKHSVQSITLGKDTFAVTVYPNVDYAFIVALVVILREINKAKNNVNST